MQSKLMLGLFVVLPFAAYSACSSSDDSSSAGGSSGTTAHAGSSGRGGAANVGSGGVAGDDMTGGTSVGATSAGGSAGSGEAGSGAESNAGAAGAAARLSDAQILKIVVDASSGEVSAAEVAKPAAQSASVATFAQSMITDHSAGEQQALALVTSEHVGPEPSEVSNKLEAETAALLATLSQTPSAAFDTVYMKSQVDMHQEVLTLIDARLLPDVTDAALMALLTNMRVTVAAHLQQAQTIVAAL